MSDIFTDEFCLKLEGILEPDKIKQVRDLLYVHTLDYNISPMTTELSVTDYQLPQAYRIFLAAKMQDGRMGKGTYEQYSSCLEKLLWRFQIPLECYTVNHLRLFLQECSINHFTGKPNSRAYLNQRKCIIRSFFHWLYEEEYIQKDPSIRIHPEKDNAKPRTAFKDTEIEVLRNESDDLRTRALIDLLSSSGIRVAECANLKIADIDFDSREIRVFGKGEKWRTAYISAAAVVSLTAYLKSRTDDNPTLFVSLYRPHNAMTTHGIRKCLRRLSDKTNIDGVIPHRFRHTMATTAINRGMPITSIQQTLGHENTDTTMRYAHVSGDKVKRDYQSFMG